MYITNTGYSDSQWYIGTNNIIVHFGIYVNISIISYKILLGKTDHFNFLI